MGKKLNNKEKTFLENIYKEFEAILTTDGYNIYVMEMKDQDGGEHIIYVDTNNINIHKTVIQLGDLYNIIFGEGKTCRIRSKLYEDRGFISNTMDKYTYISVASIAIIINKGPSDMELLSIMIGWLYGEYENIAHADAEYDGNKKWHELNDKFKATKGRQ